ncbi:MAG: transketolase [Fibrobacteria bacterium]|nr:transketolase [Fibrobacteria bacterium]
MGADTSSTVEAKKAPAIKPVISSHKLAGTPQDAPKYPITVKKANGEDAVIGDPKASRALIALMDQHAVNGGAACHWGGGAAFAEILAAVHGVMFEDKSKTWHEHFNFVNDAGHAENGVYAIQANLGFNNMTFEDVKGFRSIASKFTGHGESHLNPEGVLVSNGPLGSGIPQAQGLCAADKVIGNDRVTFCTLSDGASMEGEAKESFSAIPGLASKGRMNPFVLLISDNNTKLSGRIDEDSFSMAPSFAAMDALGWNVIRVDNGHDMQKVYSAVEKGLADAVANPDKPVCIICKTIKGYGVKATEESASGGHGYPLKKNDGKIAAFVAEIYDGNPPAEFKEWAESLAAIKSEPKAAAPAGSVKKDKVQPGFAKGAIKAIEEGYPVYSVSCDVQGSTGIAPMQKTFPDRFVEVGIAEANMVNTAAGMSLAGLIPIVDTFTQFGVTKGNLPLTMAALSQAPIVCVFSHCGLQDAADGASHEATTYLAAVSSIPHTQVAVCACQEEAESYMYQALKTIGDSRRAGEHPDSVVFFLGREGFPVQYKEGLSYEWGKAQVLREGSDVTIAACGPMVDKALAAADQLKEKGVSATVINTVFINNPDVATIGECVKKTGGKLVTVEDHQVIAGMGAQLIHALTQNGVALSARSIGIPGQFGKSAYVADELYDAYGLNAAKIVEAVESIK